MLNSARITVQRTVQHLCRQPTSRCGTGPRQQIGVWARPWIWTSLRTVAHGTERTCPVMVTTRLCSTDVHSKSVRRGSIPLFTGSSGSDWVQINSKQNHVRRFSVQTRQEQKQNSSDEVKNIPEEKRDSIEKPVEQLTLVQRFKKTYKEHGKVLIGVHLLTSCVWFGTFYGIVDSGVDIVALLERLGFSETITNPFKSSSLGNVALAYLMYKLATPARYTVTIGGTNMVIRYMRKTAKIPPLKQEDKLRSMFKEGVKDAKDQGTIKFKQSRAKARVKRRAANAQRTRKVKAAGRRFISNFKSRRDRFLLKLKSSQLKKYSKRKSNGNGANK